MNNTVPCPDNGSCGHKNHRPGSHAYKWCLYKASARSRHQGKKNVSRTPPISASDAQKRTLPQYNALVEEAREKGAYNAAESFVTSDMVIPEESVQTYIDDPTELNYMSREEWEERVLDDIRGRTDEIGAKLGFSVDDLDEDELDILAQAVFDSDRSDIAGAEAKNMKPRTFTHFCSPTETGRRAAFDKAVHEYDAGSDEWYDTLAAGYHRDLMAKNLSYPGDGSNGDEDRQAITSALKQAIGNNPENIAGNYYDLPGIEVVWTGNLSDVGPNDDDGSSEKLHITRPYLILTDGMGGTHSDPVQLHGDYVVDLPSREERLHGAESGIRDDMTGGNMRHFDYPDGAGLAKFKAAATRRTFE